jgi:uncharacterized phage protein (TIGR02218 family)
MKSTDSRLVAYMAAEVTHLATCWKVTRKDGAIYGFTSHTEDLTIGGIAYSSSLGQSPTNIITSDRLDVDNLEITAFLDASTITEADVVAGLWDYAAVEVFRVDYSPWGLTYGVDKLRKGWTGEVKTGRVSLKSELRGSTQPLQQEVGRIYVAACDADLGDARCGITLATYTVTGTVTTAASNRVFTDSTRAEASGHFAYGKITWTSGLNSGLGMEVKSFSAGVFSLQEAMPYVVTVGDAYSVYAGCDKTKAMCIAKFNNVINFRGFDMVPGGDRMVSGK